MTEQSAPAVVQPAAYTKGWDDTQVATLRAAYEASPDAEGVAAAMEALNKSKRMVIGKLTSEGVYVAPEKAAPAKRDEGPTKGEVLSAIAATGFDVSGFDNATKDALKRLQAFVEAQA